MGRKKQTQLPKITAIVHVLSWNMAWRQPIEYYKKQFNYTGFLTPIFGGNPVLAMYAADFLSCMTDSIRDTIKNEA